MTHIQDALDRRGMLALAVAGGATLATAAPARATPAGSVEAANLKLTADFCASWAQGSFDFDRMIVTYFHPACIVRLMDSTLTATGHAGASAMMKGWLEDNRHFDLKILKSQALGPMVIQTREDYTYSPGQPPHIDKIASVFVIADGKIKEWSDYFM